MTTDYLGTKFPPYVLTEDTSVVSLKRYFRQEGSGYVPVLDSLSSDNPKAKGWYEFKNNHNEEFRFHVGSIQVNNVSDICHSLLTKLQQFPQWTLPRTTTIGTATIDWKGRFADAVWNETIGSMIVPPYGVPFSTNLYLAKNINTLMNKYLQMNHSDRESQTRWTELKPDVQAFIDAIVTVNGKNYQEFGYSFDPTTLGNTERTEDLFTLAGYWGEIEFREVLRMLQDSYHYTMCLSGLEELKELYTQLIELFQNAARTMMDLSKRTNSLEVMSKQKYTTVEVDGVATTVETSTSDHREFIIKIVSVPGTIDIDGTTYYRLDTTAQLVANEKYGLLVYNNDKTVSVLEPETVDNPTIKFAWLNLPAYTGYITTEAMDLPVRMVQNKKIWFTTVPFSGPTTS